MIDFVKIDLVKIAAAAIHRRRGREHLAFALHLLARRNNPWINQRFTEFDDEEIDHRRWLARQEYCRYRTLTGRACHFTRRM